MYDLKTNIFDFFGYQEFTMVLWFYLWFNPDLLIFMKCLTEWNQSEIETDLNS